MATKKGRFRLPKRTALIQFEDGEYAGAEVRCSLDVPMRTLLTFKRMAGGEVDQVERGYELFGKQMLIDWNLEDDEGQPIPCSTDHFMEQPLAFLNAVTAQWIEAVTGVPKDSNETSANGSTLAAASVPTEPE